MKKLLIPSLGLFLLLIAISCKEESTDSSTELSDDEAIQTDPLPSWNNGTTKDAIINYVEAVTDETGPDFIPKEDRIATFDNDGNLWSEQPAYFQLFFAMDRVKAMAPDHPEWAETMPFQAVLEDDMAGVIATGEHGLLELVMASHAGMTADEFESIVAEWLDNSRHPRFNKPYNALVYQPMLELLDYLRSNDFKTFIVSGGGVEFMRVWTNEVYGIPSDQVVGSSIKTVFEYEDGKASIHRLAELDFIDDKAGKPVGIQKFIGKRPVFASGNSDGDLQMLQFSADNEYRSFQLYLHHTDAEREWAYDRDSHIGRLDKGLDEAASKGWTVIDMKNDWKVIYPFELP
jgi:hypothetical protein